MENRKVNINLRPEMRSGQVYPRREASGERLSGAPSFGGGTFEIKSERTDSKFITKMLDKVVNFSMFMLFLGIPIFFSGITFQGLIFEKQLFFYFFLLLALVSWAAKGVLVGEMNIRKTPLDIPILGLWLAYLVSTFFSVDRWHSFWGAFSDPSRGLMNVTALVVSYYLITSNFSKKFLNLMLLALNISIAFVILWTTLVIFNVKFLPDSIAAFSPISLLGSISGLAIFLSVSIAIIMISILKLAENDEMKKNLKNSLMGGMLLVFVVNLLLLPIIYNFVPWLGLFIGISIFVVFILAKIVSPHAKWVWLPLVVFILVMILYKVESVNVAKITLPVEVGLNYQPSWEIASSALKEKFIVGSGPATYIYDFSKFKSQAFNTETFYNLRFDKGTGIIFEALPTLGAFGTFFLVLLMLSYVGVSIFLLAKDKEKNKLYSLGLFAASIIFMVDFIVYRADGNVLILAGLLGALSLATTLWESGSQENYLSLSLKASPKFALALAFVFMVVSAGVAFLFVFLGKIYAADVYAGSAARKIGVDSEKSIVNMSRAIQFNDKEGRYYTQLGQYYMILANTEAIKGETERDIQKIQQYLNYSIGITRQGGILMKNDVLANEGLAQIYENAGLYVADSLEMASQAYEKSLELEPHNPVYYLKLGQIKISQATIDKDEAKKKQLVGEAKDLFQKSIDEKANFDIGYYQLSLAQEALGELDQAIENRIKAVQINPQSNDYIIGLARIYQTRGTEDDLKLAEQLFKALIQRNDNDINSHFYLGVLYEKMKKKQDAKNEYKKVISILPENSEETKKQLEKMISNIDAGIENTPKNLGLVQEEPATEEGGEAPAQQEQPVE